MKLYILAGLAVLLLCSTASGYFYISGDSQVLPGEKARVSVCAWNRETVDLRVYKLSTGTISEFIGKDTAAALSEAMRSTPVYSKTFTNLDDCRDIEMPLGKGFYMVYGKSKDHNETKSLLVSQLGLVSKTWEDGSMIYSLDLAGGQTLPGTDVKIYRNGELASSGKTGADGMLKTKVNMSGETIVVGQNGDDFAVMSPYYYGWWGESSKTYIYTDRPIYRPNQDVYFKVIAWGKENGAYEIPTGTAQVTISDAKGNDVYSENLTLSEFGTVSGKLSLGDEPPLGYYAINVKVGDLPNGYGSFQVEEYKKPEYEVTVTPEKESYVKGDTARIEVDAQYYFGSPVVDADVSYTIRQSGWYRPCRGYICPFYKSDYYRPWYYGEEVASGEGKTDSEGKFQINMLANSNETMTYSVEVKVTDKSRREVDGSGSFTAYRGEFDFYVTTDRWSYKKGDNVRIKVTSTDVEQEPVSAFGKMKVELREWKETNGRWDEKVTKVLEREVETDSNGEATVDFTADKGGSYYITITGRDARGNNITSDGYFYVSSEEPYWYMWKSLDVKLDRETYKSGDAATLTIMSPVSDFTALVTVEADGVYDYYVKSFSGTTGSVEIPVKDLYKPNVEVEVMVVRNRTQYSSSATLVVPPEERFLNITIATDKDEYMPGDEAVFTVTARDVDGNPVAAELSLGVVDESIYAIAEESVSSIDEFFYGPRWSTVSTERSWEYWGGLRDADMALATGAAAEESAPAMAPGAAKLAYDGGLVAAELRKYFPDTAFWHAHIKTDANGVATVRVTIPDSLTTWRATVRGISKSFQVGQQTDKVIARKNLMVRLETPRFLTQGDELVISGVVHNYLKNTKNVHVSLIAKGVEVTGSTEQVITVAPGADERVDWKVKASSCCKANFTITALTNEESDAMQLALPIVPYGIEETDYWAGSIGRDSGSVTKNIVVPEDSVYGATTLKLVISPSIASTAFDALEYLASYPYGCVEQTMSSFLPDIYVYQVLKDMGIKNEKLEAELPEMVGKGLQQLYSMQHSDGGWGWWTNDETHPYMTAYAVYGLTLAERAGFTVDDGALRKGLSSLKKQYNEGFTGTNYGGGGSGNDANTRAYMAWVISFHETPSAYPEDKDLNDYGLALKTLARANRGEAVEFPGKLRTDAICDELSCHWSSETFHYSWSSNDVETTAMALMALMKTEPDNDMAERAVRWLVSKRRGNYWHSTKDTATAVFALSEYMRVSKERSPNYVANVYVNGELVKSVRKDDAFDMDNTITLEPRAGQNEIKIVKDGSGRLYYSLFLTYFREESPIRAKSAGITVSRKYNVTSVKTGEYIRVNLSVEVSGDQEYIILEDPIPAGCEVVEEVVEAVPYYYYYDYYWPYWYHEKEVRDEKVAYFMTYLRPGKNELSYTLRAEVPGKYKVMPASAWNMYDEKITGHSDEDNLEISDKLVVRIGEVVVKENSVDFTVDALKLAEGDLSAELVAQVRQLDGGVLKETREYVTIKGAETSKSVSLPVHLADGLYTITYTVTTSDGDVISGSKRVQVGVVPEAVTQPAGQPSTAQPKEGGGNDVLVIGLAVLLGLLIGFMLVKKKPVAKKKKA